MDPVYDFGHDVYRWRPILPTAFADEHGAKKSGLDAQNRDGHPAFAAYLRGKRAYLSMIDPTRGRKMLAELDAIEHRSPR